jgi:hypothetical protein
MDNENNNIPILPLNNDSFNKIKQEAQLTVKISPTIKDIIKKLHLDNNNRNKYISKSYITFNKRKYNNNNNTNSLPSSPRQSPKSPTTNHLLPLLHNISSKLDSLSNKVEDLNDKVNKLDEKTELLLELYYNNNNNNNNILINTNKKINSLIKDDVILTPRNNNSIDNKFWDSINISNLLEKDIIDNIFSEINKDIQYYPFKIIWNEKLTYFKELDDLYRGLCPSEKPIFKKFVINNLNIEFTTRDEFINKILTIIKSNIYRNINCINIKIEDIFNNILRYNSLPELQILQTCFFNHWCHIDFILRDLFPNIFNIKLPQSEINNNNNNNNNNDYNDYIVHTRLSRKNEENGTSYEINITNNSVTTSQIKIFTMINYNSNINLSNSDLNKISDDDEYGYIVIKMTCFAHIINFKLSDWISRGDLLHIKINDTCPTDIKNKIIINILQPILYKIKFNFGKYTVNDLIKSIKEDNKLKKKFKGLQLIKNIKKKISSSSPIMTDFEILLFCQFLIYLSFIVSSNENKIFNKTDIYHIRNYSEKLIKNDYIKAIKECENNIIEIIYKTDY